MATTAVLALGAATHAQAGSYITIFGGANFQADADVFGSSHVSGSLVTGSFGIGTINYSSTLNFAASAELDTGFVVGAAFGRDLNDHWRMELELAYRENAVNETADFRATVNYAYTGSVVTTVLVLGTKTFVPVKGSVSGSGSYAFSGTTGIDGDVSFFSVMGNVWYDFIVADDWEAFVGAGLGVAQVNYNGIKPAGTVGSYYALTVDESDWVFAYQFGLGAMYTLDNGVRLSAQYRYFGTDDATFGGAGDVTGEASSFLAGISFPIGD